jgi:hypothetical protein
MYPLGILFGLGFDTATEVALLVLAGTAVVSGLPFYAILSLPILFAAGMCLFDTADGCFMNFAYDWAFANPVRKVFYNLTITGLSVFVAFFIGTIEILGLIGSEYHLTGGFWSFMAAFDINKAGFVIVGIFIVTWIVALAIWRFGKLEQKWDLGGAGGAHGGGDWQPPGVPERQHQRHTGLGLVGDRVLQDHVVAERGQPQRAVRGHGQLADHGARAAHGLAFGQLDPPGGRAADRGQLVGLPGQVADGQVQPGRGHRRR